jgi:hypothetical protein
MWYDWLKSTQAFCHAWVSSRQFVYSGGTPGYALGPVCRLRSNLTGSPAACKTSSRLFWLIPQSPSCASIRRPERLPISL